MRAATAFAVVLSIAVAACSSGDGSDSSRALDVFGPYRGVEADYFTSSLAKFELETGIEVRYTGSADFVGDLRARAIGGVSLPDIAIVPQPGVIDGLIADDGLVPLSDETLEAVEENYARTSPPSGRSRYVAPFRSTVKSLIWYRPDVFAENGWTTPATLDELTMLVDDIASRDEQGPAPWCFTMFAGSATGWAATDWVEDILLRQSGPEVYDEWVSGQREFGDPDVVAAFETFADLVLADGHTAGGLPAIVEEEVTLASEPLFADEPGCAMYKQATFAADWFPDDVTIGDDVDFFVMPTDEGVAPLVTGGDGLVQFRADDRVDRLMQYLVSPDGAREWARRGGYVSARTSVDADRYYSDADRDFAELLLEDRISRFDASDTMPPEIGSSLFWTEITEWIRGSSTLDDFLTTMDDARAAQ